MLAAREVFAEQGCDAPLEEIARRAGVGAATMYRHFHARHELVIAANADEVAALCARVGTLVAELSPADALFGWLHAVVDHLATKQDVARAVIADGPPSALLDRWQRAIVGATSTLLVRAQRDGAVRADLDPADLVPLAAGVALTEPSRRARLLDVLRNGVDRREA